MVCQLFTVFLTLLLSSLMRDLQTSTNAKRCRTFAKTGAASTRWAPTAASATRASSAMVRGWAASTSMNVTARPANSTARTRRAVLFALVLLGSCLMPIQSRAVIWMSALLGKTCASRTASTLRAVTRVRAMRDTLKWATSVKVSEYHENSHSWGAEYVQNPLIILGLYPQKLDSFHRYN